MLAGTDAVVIEETVVEGACVGLAIDIGVAQAVGRTVFAARIAVRVDALGLIIRVAAATIRAGLALDRKSVV